jgi:1,4-dihydroxy-2-naphthoate octaprenyltransferase
MSFVRLSYFLRLTRPFFLLGGILLYLLGVAAALVDGTPFHLAYFLLGQLLVTSIQLMVHYANEYFDQDVDRAITDRTWFSGGSGVLASGALPPVTALRAAQVCLGIALFVLLAVLAVNRSPALAALLALALLAGWFYSAPPLRLVSRGWGEVTASLVVALFVPLAGFLLQTGGNALPFSLLKLCLPLVLIHMSMLLAFEFPDQEADAAFAKRTLTVRLGPLPAAWLHHTLLLAAFGLIAFFTISSDLAQGGGLAFLALPLAIWQVFRLHWQRCHPTASYRWFAAGAVMLFALAAFLVLIGLLFSS